MVMFKCIYHYIFAVLIIHNKNVNIMTKTTMRTTRYQNGTREVCLDILIYFIGQITRSVVNIPKTTYTISGNIVGDSSMPRKITVCYKETASKASIIISEEGNNNFNDEIIIEESDTYSVTARKIIIEESDTYSIIIEESDTNSSIIVSIPKGKTNSANGVAIPSETEAIPQ